jgi:hypothetical protein
MRSISNYIAALITAAMIFTSIAFFISTNIRQVEISNYAMNTMVQLSDRARENLAISYVFTGNNKIIISLINTGSIDITLSYIIFIDKYLNTYTYSLNLTIPIGTAYNLRYTLPFDKSKLYDIKITTSRGNIFDVLSPTIQPIDTIIYPNTTRIKPVSEFMINIVIKNRIPSEIIIYTDSIKVSFINYVSGENITKYFILENITPSTPIVLKPGDELIITEKYIYVGGISSETPIDIYVLIHTITSTSQEVYSSTTLNYGLITS